MLSKKRVILRTTTKERIEELRAYKEKHGDCNVTYAFKKECPGLYNCLKRHRSAKRRGKLNPEVEAALNELGVQWENPLTTGFRSQELIYKNQHGDFNVPWASEEYSVLTHWLRNQRWKRRQGKLNPEIEASLDEMGFEWEPPPPLQARTLNRIEEIRDYKKEHGNFNVPLISKEYLGLGHWIGNQRRKKRRGNIEPEVKVALDEMGFEWEMKFNNRSEEWIEELRAYKEKHGDWYVPFNSEEYSRLYNWCILQRSRKRRGKILREIEIALDELGFEWEGKRVRTSAPELRIFTELQFIFDRVIHRHKVEGHEVDIYLPEINLAIEYDGSYWHRDIEDRDLKKNCFFKSKNIPLMRVRHFPLKKLSEQDLVVKNEPLTKTDLNFIVASIRAFVPKNTVEKLDVYENSETFLNEERKRFT